MKQRLLLLVLPLLFAACMLQSPDPPAIGQPYPDLQLIDESGASVPLSAFRGKVTLLHAVSMGCTICQGLSGADEFGPFGFTMPGVRTSSIETYFSRYAPYAMRNPDLQIIQLVFFNSEGNAPSPAELRAWSEHFHLHERGIIVLGAPTSVSESIGRQLIPGFQLLDRNFVLRSDSTGGSPQNDFARQLLPQMTGMLRAG